MKKLKFITIILAFAIGFSSLGGCGRKAEQPPVSQTQENTQNNEESAQIKITDQIGREVILEKPAEKIVSSYYISTAILISLGLSDNLVGIEAKADTRELYKKAANDIISLPAVGSGKGINIEETAALAPDVVIIPQKLKDAVSSFEELNIPVVVVDPETLDNFKECVSLLGEITATSQTADKLIAYYDEKMNMVKDLTKGLEKKPAVYLSGSDMLTTCTSKMYQNQLIETSGGENVSKELTDGYWQNISAEQLNLWAPEYFFAVSYADYSLEEVKSNAALKEIPAVKDGNLFVFPSSIEPWDYPTPSSILGVLYLTHILHPDIITAEDYVNEAADFYDKFFNIQVTKEDLGL